ncbi:MAG TPA: hypothetical protein VFI91_03215 [Longimicrobiaceae bacterium]|nr:hypothetical protein [Longimicrobiaceae bacterium]
MRAFLAPLMLLATVSACATHAAPSNAPYRSNNTSLRAQIHATPNGYVDFYVNQDAYVALFEVVPGVGVSVLYPYPGRGRMSGFVYAGMRSIPNIGNRTRDPYWHASTARTRTGPRYIYMIASEQPLNVDQFGAFGSSLWSQMGVSFASYSPYRTMEDLTALVVPNLNYGNWTTDVYMIWPNVLYNSPRQGSLVAITCDGHTYYVRRADLARVYRNICGVGNEVPIVRDSTDNAEPRGDVPTRLRPVPTTTKARPDIWANEAPNDGERRARPRPMPGGSNPRAEPARTAPSVEPRRDEPRRMEPRQIEPRREVPRRVEPRRVEPPRPRATPQRATPKPSRPAPVVRPRPAPPSRPATSKPVKKKSGGGGRVG